MNNVNSSVAVVDETNSQEEESIIERIANGSDEVIGDGVYFDGDSKARFTSGGINHTHQYIVAKAITILKKDNYDDSIGSQTSGTVKTRFIEYFESAVQIYNTNRHCSMQPYH